MSQELKKQFVVTKSKDVKRLLDMRHGDFGHLSSCLGSALVLGFKGLFDTWCIKIIEKNVKKDLMFRYGCSNARERNEKQMKTK